MVVFATDTLDGNLWRRLPNPDTPVGSLRRIVALLDSEGETKDSFPKRRVNHGLVEHLSRWVVDLV